MIYSDFKLEELLSANNSGIILPAIRVWESNRAPVLFLGDTFGIHLTREAKSDVMTVSDNFHNVRTKDGWRKPSGFKFVYETDEMKIIIKSKDVL